MFNAHYDERCFLPIHVYDTATSRPVAVLLRPGKTPSGQEIRGHCGAWCASSVSTGYTPTSPFVVIAIMPATR